MPKHTLVDEMGPWVPLPESIIEMVPQIGTDAAFLMLYFRYRLNRYRDPEKTWPGYATMSKEIGWGTQKISKIIKVLEEHNLITKKKRYGTSSEYTIRYPQYQPEDEDTQSFENQRTEDKSLPQSFENQNSITDSPLKIKVQSFENQRGVLDKDKTLKEEIKESKPPKKPRKRDLLFDAIADVCQVDPKTAGASIAKVRHILADAGYTPEDIYAFQREWKKEKWRTKPPTIWQLKEQIGIIKKRDTRSRREQRAAMHQAESDRHAEKRRRRIHAQDMARRMEGIEEGQSGTD